MQNLFLASIYFPLLALIANAYTPNSLPNCPTPETLTCSASEKYRRLDGSCNNFRYPQFGRSRECFARMLPPLYGAKGLGHKIGRISKSAYALPNARHLSNEYHSDRGVQDPIASHWTAQFGLLMAADMFKVAGPKNFRNQFPCCLLKHPQPDICDPIDIWRTDPFYSRYGQTCLNKFRSLNCEQCENKPREQRNDATAFLDLSPLYGTTDGAMRSMRTFVAGRLKTSADVYGRQGLLPRSGLRKEADGCDPRYDTVCFETGGGVGDESPLLAAVVTIWARNHNRLATALSKLNPFWPDDRVFEEARKINIAQYQHVIYNEFLNPLIGRDLMAQHKLYPLQYGNSQYDTLEDPSILNEFATAAWRLIESMVQGEMAHLTAYGQLFYSQLRKEWNHPIGLYNGELDNLVRGMARQSSAAVDPYLVDDLRNHWKQRFNDSFGFDAAAFIVESGRDHGIRPYVDYVKLCDGQVVRTFTDLSQYMDYEKWQKLSSIYTDVGDVDLWTGGLSERPLPNALVGPVFACIIGIQMERLKFGDRFYYEHAKQAGSMTALQLKTVRRTHFAAILCHNSDAITEMQLNPFLKVSDKNPIDTCRRYHDISNDLYAWKE